MSAKARLRVTPTPDRDLVERPHPCRTKRSQFKTNKRCHSRHTDQKPHPRRGSKHESQSLCEGNHEFLEGWWHAEGSSPRACVPSIADALQGCGLNHIVQLGTGAVCSPWVPPTSPVDSWHKRSYVRAVMNCKMLLVALCHGIAVSHSW